MNIREYFRPSTMDEAYEILQKSNATIIGGGAFLNLGSKGIDTAIDLSGLNLDFIREKDGEIEIGAMTTLRNMETSNLLQNSLDGILPEILSNIMGVQIRNTATIGGTIYGRYGFSDLLTTLLALDSYVELYMGGRISLERFLEDKASKDIVVKIIVKNQEIKASYQNIRITATDFSVLNAAVVRNESGFRICVGSRPARAKVSYEGMDFINSIGVNEENAAKAGEIVSENLQFGNDIRASLEYRKEICKVLIKRCILEVSI